MSFWDKMWKKKFPIPTEQIQASETKEDRIEKISRPVIAFFAKYLLGNVSSFKTGRKEFTEECPVDLDEIRRAYTVDSYIRQSIDKYVDLIFKAGWILDGKNPDSTRYIKQRLQLIADATSKPTEIFLRQLGADLVKYDNVFIVLKRQEYKNNPYRIKINEIGGKKSIAGLFFMHPASVRIVRDDKGNIVKYKQVPIGNKMLLSSEKDYPQFSPDEVIHIYSSKENGFAFGVPYVAAAIEDVKVLRVIEENVARLTYRMTFPFVHVKVGNSGEGQQAHEEEIDAYKKEIESQPVDATLVTNERVSIDIKGVEGEALDVDKYLGYFENRTFTGLAVSGIQMGRGDTANRSTSDTLSTELHDKVKSFQKVISTFLNELLIKQFLLEGGYDFFSNPDYLVSLTFREIELDSEIKTQAHSVFLYEHGAIDENELRRRIGLEPVIDSERDRMHLNVITIPKLKAAAMAKLEAGGSGNPETDNIIQPANQHGKRLAPKIGKKESIEKIEDSIIVLSQKLSLYYDDLINDLIYTVSKGKGTPALYANLTRLAMKKSLTDTVYLAFRRGVERLNSETGSGRYATTTSSVGSEELRRYVNKYLDKFSGDVEKVCASTNGDEVKSKLETMRYRLHFMADQQVKQAYWLGYARAAEKARNKVELKCEDRCCGHCEQMVGILTEATIDSVPAHHPGCKCKLEVIDGK